MEVIVRNLHDQITEKQVENYFRPVLGNLGITTFHCQKLRGKGCATITILDKSKGQKFLQLHGQTKPGAQGFMLVQRKLLHLGRPVNCDLSRKAPDEYLIESLKKEENDRRKPKIVPGRVETRAIGTTQRAFDIAELHCGRWTYVSDHLAFSTYSSERRTGRIIFASRSLLIKLEAQIPSLPSHQIEVPYGSVESFTIGSNHPSLTFSLSEAPKIFENLAHNPTDLEAALQQLTLRAVKQKITRKRISAISNSHERVVASCLCYRLVLSRPSDVRLIQSLKAFPEIPSSIMWNTAITSRASFAVQMTELNNALTGRTYSAMPFDVKFQIQKLAQNGYLSPSRVTKLMPTVSNHLLHKETAIVASSLRSLALQIPFAGPDAEASEFSLTNLEKALSQSETSVYEEDLFSQRLANQHDHISMVHKAMVTPAGIYLYGPEPEIKNRVLRKYSAYPNHFLSVSFLDENGEQLRFDRQTSSQDIYYRRFMQVLKGVINIAGRGYEVSHPYLCMFYR